MAEDFEVDVFLKMTKKHILVSRNKATISKEGSKTFKLQGS